MRERRTDLFRKVKHKRQIHDLISFASETSFLALLALTLVAFSNAQKATIYVETGHSVDQMDLSKDGLYILTSNDLESTKLWDVRTGRELWTFPGACGRFSPTRPVLLTEEGSKGITLWDVSTGAAIDTFMGHTDTVTGMAFFPDGNRFVSVSRDSTVRIWNIAGDRQSINISHQLQNGNYFNNVAVSSSGKLFAAGSTDGKVSVWESVSGKLVNTFDAGTDRISSVAFSHDNKYVVSAGSNKKVIVWDIGRGKMAAEFSSGDEVTSAIFSPDDRSIIYGNAFTDDIHVRNMASGSEVLLKGHESWVNGLDFATDGHLVSASKDGTVRLWDIGNKSEIRRFSGSSVQIASDVALSPNSRFLLNNCLDRVINIWDLSEGTLRKFPGDKGKFSPDSLSLVTAEADPAKPGVVSRWDLKSGAKMASVSAHNHHVTRLSLTEKYLVTSSQDKTVRVSDPATLNEIFRFTGHVAEVPFAILSWDDSLVGSFDTNNEILVWEPETGKIRFRFHHPDGTLLGFPDKVDSLLFSDDNKLLISRSHLKLVAWDLTSGKNVEERDISEISKATPGVLSLITRMGRLVRQFDATSNDGKFLFKRLGQYQLGVYLAAGYKQNSEQNVPLLTLMVTGDSEWVITTPEGRFDTSRSLENIEGLHWTINDEILSPLPLEIFMRQYYEPDLLRRVMAGEAFTPLPSIGEIKRIRPTMSDPRVSQPIQE